MYLSHIFWRKCFTIGLEDLGGIDLGVQSQFLINILFLKISQVEIEIPDVKVFSDSAQELHGARIKRIWTESLQ